MILVFPRAKQGLCHYDMWGGASLIRYSPKTAEQNFMKLSGIVHYMMSYCTSYFKFLFEWFWGFPEHTRTLPYKTWGSGGYHFVSIAHSISSLPYKTDQCALNHILNVKYKRYVFHQWRFFGKLAMESEKSILLWAVIMEWRYLRVLASTHYAGLWSLDPQVQSFTGLFMSL